jgi:2-keto-3-deoxy-L-rhamnonate aldolase RhmA
VPRVESAAEAEHAVARLRYPPGGSRGLAARRASGYGAGGSTAGDPVCVVQIESAAAVGAANDIAAVDGVDALVVGAADLAADMGDGLEPESPALPDAIERVRRACGLAGVPFGVAGPADADLLSMLAGPSARMLVLGADVRLYALAVRAALERVRDAARHPEEARVGA